MEDKNDIIKKSWDFATKFHKTDTTGHDLEHIKRVYNNVLLLLSDNKKANKEIVKISAILHDIDDRKLNFKNKRTETFLKKMHLPQAEITKIIDTIDSIDFGTTGDNPHLDTIEKKILFDADKLDAIGSIGICRTIMYGNSKGLPLFNCDIFPKDNLTKEEYRNLKRNDYTTINHFFDKLLKLSKIMQTNRGKLEAQKRQKIMVSFLKEFFMEENQEKWLSYLNDYLKKL